MDYSASNKKVLPIYIGTAALSFLMGLVMFIAVAPHAASGFVSVVAVIVGVLAVLEALAIGAFILLSFDGDANFFLYDRKTGTNLSEEDLTFDRLNARMGYYMTLISSSQEQVWI